MFDKYKKAEFNWKQLLEINTEGKDGERRLRPFNGGIHKNGLKTLNKTSVKSQHLFNYLRLQHQFM